MTKGDDGFVKTIPVGHEQYTNDIPMHDYKTVADKYMGTVTDKHDMMVLGRAQVLRVGALGLN